MRVMMGEGARFPEAWETPFYFGDWPAHWVSVIGEQPRSFVAAYRLAFKVDAPQTVRIHVTADQRYELLLDGRRIGRGSERGDVMHWFYETYDLPLSAGEHVLVGRTWYLDQPSQEAPIAQTSLRHGFLLAAEGSMQATLSTGLAPWTAKMLGGYAFRDGNMPGAGSLAGGTIRLDGREHDWDWQRGGGDGWAEVKKGPPARDRLNRWGESLSGHRLCPAVLPPMLDEPKRLGRVLTVNEVATAQWLDVPVETCDSDARLAGERDAWQALLDGNGGVTVGANQRRRIVVDLDDYYCLYPQLTLSGGRDATVHVAWAESLYVRPNSPNRSEATIKGNRDRWEGKYFRGRYDVFIADGGEQRVMDTLWWQCGRYIEIVVETRAQPLRIDAIAFHETRYPLEMEGRVALSDARFNAVVPIMWRTMQMCSHETYMDCPYYEQLMYTGDTRLEVLVTYLMTADDRLPRKAIRMFGQSHSANGLTHSRYPAQTMQMIPQFSLYFVALLHDFALWRGDRAFVAQWMPRARQVLEAFISRMDATGLVQWPEGWNWVDWVPEWENGNPLSDPRKPNGVNQWQFCYVLGLALELERWLGEEELADRLARVRRKAADCATAMYWDDQRGMFADSREKDRFSEHAQCFAVLSGLLDADRQQRVLEGVLAADDLARATVYFQHYLFEIFRLADRTDVMLQRMQLWFDMPAMGLKTCLEKPEPSRSDCHAWGAHPIYHAGASIVGIRPARIDADEIIITPQLGSLEAAEAEVFVRRGWVKAKLQRRGDGLTGQVELPDGMRGRFVYGAVGQVLQPGRNDIAAAGG